MKLNRRQLLGSAAAVAATAAAPAAMAAVKEEKTDLVIVGGGLGGRCAAYAAVRKGVKPIVLEKLQFLGGAGLFPEGSLGVNTRYTKEHGIKTTVQEVLDAALQYHHFRADPAILRVLIEESSRTIDDVLDLGIELRGIRTVYPKEESLQTWHLFKGGCAAVIQKFVEQVKAKGGVIHTETSAQKLIMEAGRVAGVEATAKNGDKFIIHAKKVIIGKNMTPELFDRAVKNGVIKKYATLEDMAADLKIPLDELKKTNETFNSYIKAQKDPDFNCMMFKDATPNEKNLLVVRLWPRVHHCMGGLEINDKAQVLSVRGEPINGLYAAGEVTGGVHGMVRLGTVAVADCIIFGRVAARTANAFKGC